MLLEKFKDPLWTAKKEERASVPLKSLETLWFNTGTRCNLSCENCYIESNPKNDRLSFLNVDDVKIYLDEIKQKNLPVREIGLTGGEPFLNPHISDIIDACLKSGLKTLVLTNAFRIDRYKDKILEWQTKHPNQILFRVSLDHYSPEVHEEERGVGTFAPTMKNIQWFFENKVPFAVAGRILTSESKGEVVEKYAMALQNYGVTIDPNDTSSLVVFAEMDMGKDVPEITTACWGILKKSPEDIMCSKSRMVVKRKGETKPKVLACTLIAYDKQFELGESLEESHQAVYLNHPFCAQFCVLGGSSCS